MRIQVRILGGLTAAVGAAFLLRPHALADRISGVGATPANAVVRVLAGRQLAQGTALLVRPERDVVRAAVGIDTLHAASMVVAPLLWPTYRRAALSSAAMATASAVAGALILITAKGQHGR